MKHLTVQNLRWLALALALAGSLRHLAAIFASIDGNVLSGWIQAIAIDAGLFSLAYSIRIRKGQKRSTRVIWLGVILFSGISVFGNLAYGILAEVGSLPTWITASKPYVLAASLPILVLYLSEVLSDDKQHADSITAKQQLQAAKVKRLSDNFDNSDLTNDSVAAFGPANLPTANEAITTKKQERMTEAADHFNAGLTVLQVAGKMDISERTAARYKSELNGTATP